MYPFQKASSRKNSNIYPSFPTKNIPTCNQHKKHYLQNMMEYHKTQENHETSRLNHVIISKVHVRQPMYILHDFNMGLKLDQHMLSPQVSCDFHALNWWQLLCYLSQFTKSKKKKIKKKKSLHDCLSLNYDLVSEQNRYKIDKPWIKTCLQQT
jgi:hypothetical protein